MVHAPAIYIHARFQGRARAVNSCKSDNPARKNSQKLHLFTVLQNYTYSYVENPSFHEHANHTSIHSMRSMFLFLPRCNYVPHKTQQSIVCPKIWNDDRRRGSKSAILPICQDRITRARVREKEGERGGWSAQ